MQIAAIASIIWGLCGILLGWAMLAPELQRAPTLLEMLSRPTAITLAATIILPIAVFWFIALLVWRAQELRLMSSAMTEVAIRLAEPDRMAEQQIASVGQAVRRQVNHMNEAVSRALGRAGELEALVHNEVASLERSYTQNENRIRGLLDELAGERNALLGTSERVSHTLKELGNDIPTLVEKLSEQQVKLARFIEQAGSNLVSLEQSLAVNATQLATSVGARTQELHGVLSGGSAEIRGLLETQTGELRGLLDQRTSDMANALQAGKSEIESTLATHTEDMQATFDGFASGLDVALGQRTEGLQTVLEEYTRALDATMEARQHGLDQQLLQRTQALDDAFTDRMKLFDDSILRSTIAIDSTVADKARALSTALETHAQEIAHVLGRQAGQLDEQIMHGVHAIRRASENVTRQSVQAIEGLAGQAELLRNLSDNVVSQIASVTERFDQQGQTMMRAAGSLETANQRIDQSLRHRQAELSRTLEHLSAKAEDVDKIMRSYPASLEGTVSKLESRALTAGEQMARGVEEHSRRALTEVERLRSAAGGETDRAVADLREKFQSISREVSEEIGSMQSRVSSSYDDLRQRAHRTLADIEGEQARLKQELERLPEATRASAETMRQSLQEQLKALEQLSTLSRREAQRADVSPPIANSAVPMPGAGRAISSISQTLANELAARHTRAPTALPPAALPPAAPVDNGRGDGWKLGDLLARASQDEAQHGELNIPGYAQALDQTTASAIWSRFRAGQRGVMVRSIYTVEGRGLFDEVQRRYAADPDFHQAVDRYQQDFLRAMREAEQRDPSGRLAQGYVVSDHGRAYLFLAHASGQLV